MGYIKEPEGIDFTVLDIGLSEEDRKTLTEHIQAIKKKSTRQVRKTPSQKKKTV